MRFPRIAVYTMTALVLGDTGVQANDSRIPDVQPPVSPQRETVLAKSVPASGATAIAAPETLPHHSVASEIAVETIQITHLQPTLGSDSAIAATPTLRDRSTATPTSSVNSGAASGVSTTAALLLSTPVSISSVETIQQPESSLGRAISQKPVIAGTPAATNCQTRTADRSASNAQLVAQAEPTGTRCPRPEPLPTLTPPEQYETESSPALSIYIPVGYGADNNTVFLSGTYQSETRFADEDDGALGLGIGLGDSRRSVGAELSYALASFGTNRNFGSGGFNAKIHRQFPGDFAAAIGWNGFLNLGDRNDFEQSLYGTITKVIRTQESISDPFSRIALTVGIGNGQFRSSGAVDDGVDNVNVFGNIAIRIARPVSFITEWTGRDLALGLSIAPFKNFPLTITPAVRDVAGAGDGARFVLGAGVAFRF